MRFREWSDACVLVAGGAGFIGSHLIDRLLAQGARVACLDNFQTGTLDNVRHWGRNPAASLIKADVIDHLPLSLRPDVIFNLACAASPPQYQADPVHTLLTSVVGTRNLLALAADTGARFVLASTSEVYGDPHVHPQPEAYFGNVNPIGPRACYDEGKRAAETLTFDYRRTRGVDARVARIFNTYGPRMRSDDGRVVSNLVTQALAGADITIYGNGTQTRSFCYVDDMVDALMRLGALSDAPYGPVNLGNPAELTIAVLAQRVLELSGSSSRLGNRPLPPDDPQRRRPDISLARETLGWQPSTDLATGLEHTIEWFRTAAGLATPSVGNRKRRLNGSRDTGETAEGLEIAAG